MSRKGKNKRVPVDGSVTLNSECLAPQSARSRSMPAVNPANQNAIASWVFGSLFTLFIFAVFAFAPATLPAYKQHLLAYVCALLAAFFAYFFTGTLAIKIAGGTRTTSQIGIQAAGGLGAFALTLWWWTSGIAPVKQEIKSGALAAHELSQPIENSLSKRAYQSVPAPPSVSIRSTETALQKSISTRPPFTNGDELTGRIVLYVSGTVDTLEGKRLAGAQVQR